MREEVEVRAEVEGQDRTNFKSEGQRTSSLLIQKTYRRDKQIRDAFIAKLLASYSKGP